MIPAERKRTAAGPLKSNTLLPVDIMRMRRADIQRRTAQAIRDITKGDEKRSMFAVGLLRNLIKDDGYYMQQIPIDALAEKGKGSLKQAKVIIGALNELAKDEESEVRWGAAVICRKIGKVNAEHAGLVVGLLEKLAGDRNAGVRKIVAEALGEIGRFNINYAKFAVGILLKLARDMDAYVQREAAMALGQIGRKDVESARLIVDPVKESTVLNLYKSKNEKEIITKVISEIGRGGTDHFKLVGGLLEKLARDEDVGTRIDVAWTLGAIGREHPKSILDTLHITSEKKDVNACCSLITTLLKNGYSIGSAKTYKDLRIIADKEIAKKMGMYIKEEVGFDLHLLSSQLLEDHEIKILLEASVRGRLKEYVMGFKENKELKARMAKKGMNTELFEKGMKSRPLMFTATGDEVSSDIMKDANRRLYEVMLAALKGEEKKNVFKKLGAFPKFVQALKEFKEHGKMTMELSKEQIERIIKSVARGSAKGDIVKGFVRDDVIQLENGLRSAGEQTKEVKRTIVFDWSDKDPKQALCEGDYSGCCVASDGTNNWTLPVYMKDYGMRIMQIKRIAETGEESRIGQAWLMTGFDAKGEPVMIVDSIELSSDYRINAIEGAAFRFLKKLAKEMGFKGIATIDRHEAHLPSARNAKIENTIYRWGDKVYSDFKQEGLVAAL